MASVVGVVSLHIHQPVKLPVLLSLIALKAYWGMLYGISCVVLFHIDTTDCQRSTLSVVEGILYFVWVF